MYEIASARTRSRTGRSLARRRLDVWPAIPDDAIAGADGVSSDTWDELIELGPKIQQPPRHIRSPMALGRGDP